MSTRGRYQALKKKKLENWSVVNLTSLLLLYTIHNSINSSVHVHVNVHEWVSVSCVDPAECVGTVSVYYCLFQDTVTVSCRAVDQFEPRSLKTPEDTEPVAEYFLAGSSHFKTCPLQVYCGNQMMNVL